MWPGVWFIKLGMVHSFNVLVLTLSFNLFTFISFFSSFSPPSTRFPVLLLDLVPNVLTVSRLWSSRALSNKSLLIIPSKQRLPARRPKAQLGTTHAIIILNFQMHYKQYYTWNTSNSRQMSVTCELYTRIYH